MSNVYSDPGYEDLWCLIGNHDFVDGRCKYCERKLRTDENVVMSILPTKDAGHSPQTSDPPTTLVGASS